MSESGLDLAGAVDTTLMDLPPAPPPPGTGGGLRELLRDNLFKDAKNTILTLVFGLLLAFVLLRSMTFLFATARWEVIRDGPLEFYMVGKDFSRTSITYEMLWAGIYVAVFATALAVGMARRDDVPPMRRGSLIAMIAGPAFGLGLILSMTRTITPTLLSIGAVATGVIGSQVGRRVPLLARRRVRWVLLGLAVVSFGLITGFSTDNIDEFGGLLLTMVVSITSIALSFPIGVLLALARRSSFPLIRPLAVVYIELIRGVPLISLLFMGQFALGFLFPPGTAVPSPVPRAILMITLFSAAYVAEVVRGGLQSIPVGQIEAGRALGLSPLTVTSRIVLPQALRNSIPALIGQFISLLKDVSLLVIIGLQEMLGIVDVVLARREFTNQGYTPEAYAFVGIVYWTLCFSMSRAAQRLETRLGVGTR